MRDFILTSESTTAGHPDKLCDQIADAVVDACLSEVPPAAVNAECAVSNGVVFLTVRREARVSLDLIGIVRRVIAETGYVDGTFAADSCTVLTTTSLIEPATADIDARAAHSATVFGYACSHTPEKMPYSLWCAHHVTRALDTARNEERLGYLLPDGQTQVAIGFRDRMPTEIHSVVLTSALGPDAPADDAALRDALVAAVIEPALAGAAIGITPGTRVLILRTAPSPAGGPANHAGLTGRKTADDSYGGYVRQSGAALSGKDPTRIDRIAAYAARHAAKCVVAAGMAIDRIAAYAARHAAKCVVAAGMARECEVQLSYAIGDAAPISIEIDSFGSGAMSDDRISARLRDVFDFRVGAIAERLDLWNLPRVRGGRFYRDLAVYGHFGRSDLAPPWEDTTAAARLA